MIQRKEELDQFHSQADPWGYDNNPDDLQRRDVLLAELPVRAYRNVLDIGCGQGFITKELPGDQVYGVDISETAIAHAQGIATNRLHFKQGSIFELTKLFDQKFDLIVITGVLYPQYIDKADKLVYLLVDSLLEKGGVLVSVHIDEWYQSQFPYLKIKQTFYDYRQFTHNLEIYVK
ncbi:class I SAM-dependent methyltransferase [Flavobacterium longum]|uniref:class I SAM-dependent methyltransferase n=1 Tax=Flavobacterium longum TaxID=1299340 RepID=UPI0039EABA8D